MPTFIRGHQLCLRACQILLYEMLTCAQLLKLLVYTQLLFQKNADSFSRGRLTFTEKFFRGFQYPSLFFCCHLLEVLAIAFFPLNP